MEAKLCEGLEDRATYEVAGADAPGKTSHVRCEVLEADVPEKMWPHAGREIYEVVQCNGWHEASAGGLEASLSRRAHLHS